MIIYYFICTVYVYKNYVMYCKYERIHSYYTHILINFTTADYYDLLIQIIQ